MRGLCELCFLRSAKVALRRNVIINDAWQHLNMGLAVLSFLCGDRTRHHARVMALPVRRYVVWTHKAVGIGGAQDSSGNLCYRRW